MSVFSANNIIHATVIHIEVRGQAANLASKDIMTPDVKI